MEIDGHLPSLQLLFLKEYFSFFGGGGGVKFCYHQCK
jgi:hypothetical protein